jgi:hypothetical protein
MPLDIRSRDPYACTPMCRLLIRVEALARPIGPAGDVIYLPLRIAGGSVEGIGLEKRIVGGSDMAMMRPDEKLVHRGSCVVADPAGNIIFRYDGTSQAEEGAYDDLLDGVLPPKIRSRLSVRVTSTNPDWRTFDERPLIGAGFFDATGGVHDVLVLSLVEHGWIN